MVEIKIVKWQDFTYSDGTTRRVLVGPPYEMTPEERTKFAVGDRVRWDEYLGDDDDPEDWVGVVVEIHSGSVRVHWDFSNEPEYCFYHPAQLRMVPQ